ncbi:MAG: thioredoxin family protein, partial [Proteobacteria bacterium]|nr:thioredoxin family protein [Pseudomonadota bacterium]
SLQIVWSEGSVADALHFAKANQKPVFIYWGAEWCPPCNQLKAEVFSNREFIEATAPMTMVMIDGDSPEAQRWSDHFNVSGYPTLLFLDNDGNQKARFVGFTPADILISTIKSLRSTTTAIKDLAGKIARSEKLSPDEWKIIAFSDWTKYSESNFGGKHPIDAALAALDQIPAELHNEKALISIFIMSSGPEAPDAQGKIINQ